MKEKRVQIKQQRIMKYFIEATEEIIKKEDIQAVTIRKVANLAGYTSATLYNYFDNLLHLVFLANMHHLEKYNEALLTAVSSCKNSIELYMTVCKCFSVHAYANPEIFELLFFSHGNDKFEKYTKQYFKLYPEESDNSCPKVLDKMFHINNMNSRSYTMLKTCIKQGYIDKDKAKDFNDICIRFNKTILEDVKDGELEKDEATALTLRYYYKLFGFYLKPEYKYMLEDYYPTLVKEYSPKVSE